LKLLKTRAFKDKSSFRAESLPVVRSFFTPELWKRGRIALNRNPDNFFAEVEQAAFNPAYPLPGIGPSPDKMLQGRLFNFGDTDRDGSQRSWQSAGCCSVTRREPIQQT
jgi:hypothetical protein